MKITVSLAPFQIVLTIIFFILKVTEVIDWSWLWVFAPIWIPVLFFLSIALFVLIVVYIFRKDINWTIKNK